MPLELVLRALLLTWPDHSTEPFQLDRMVTVIVWRLASLIRNSPRLSELIAVEPDPDAPMTKV